MYLALPPLLPFLPPPLLLPLPRFVWQWVFQGWLAIDKEFGLHADQESLTRRGRLSSNKTRTHCLVALVCTLLSPSLPPPSLSPSSLLSSSFPTRPPLLARGLLSLFLLHPLFPRTAHQHHPHLREGTQPPQNMLPHCKHYTTVSLMALQLSGHSTILDCTEGGSLRIET